MERQIVIAGHGRAGTTLLYNMLRHTLQGFQFLEREMSPVLTITQPGNICVKSPLSITTIPPIFARNIRCKRIDLIITLRDPRDLLVSRHKSVPDDYFTGADFTYFVRKDQAPTFTNPGIIPIHQKCMEMASNRDLFPRGVFVHRYENLIENPEAIQDSLSSALGLEFSGKFSDFHKANIPERLSTALNGVRPVDKGNQEKWKRPEHRRRVIDQFIRFPELHRVMAESGYATDDQWLQELIEQEEMHSQA